MRHSCTPNFSSILCAHALQLPIDQTTTRPFASNHASEIISEQVLLPAMTTSLTSEKLLHADAHFRVYLTKQTTSTIGFRWDFAEPLAEPFDLFKVEKCYSCKRNLWDVVHWGTGWSVVVRSLEQNLCYSFRINVLRQNEEDGRFLYLRKSDVFKSFTLPDVPSTLSVFRAVRKSQPALIRKLLSIKPALVNVPVHGETLLYQAVRNGNLEVIDLLLEFGADVNLGMPCNAETPLHLAVYNKNIKIARHLIEHGADMGAANCVGMTAGHYAIDTNDLHTVKYVLGNGGSLEARDRCSWTLIFRAIYMHVSTEIVKHLMERKCRLKVRDRNRLMPLDYARLTQQEEVIRLIRRRLKI